METRPKIEILHALKVEKPPQLTLSKTLYTIYSLKTFKLRNSKSTVLDLKLKIKLPDEMEGLIFLPPSITKQAVTLQNNILTLAPEEDRIIKLQLLNRTFHDTVITKKK